MPLRRTLAAAGSAVVLCALALFAPTGCDSQTTAQKENGPAELRKADPWPQAIAEIRTRPDAANSRLVLSRLGSELALNPSAEQPAGLSPQAEKSLKDVFPLDEDDLAEIRSAGFTPLDGAYLASCFYLSDAARAASPPTAPPAEQAEAAFAWVCRQVELRPWVVRVQQGLVVPALPPTAVLQRGSGSGLERAYVFLALLQQLGIDGCLIGGPDAAAQQSSAMAAPGAAIPKGPFWAVGARIGGGVLLFDPWSGQPVSGPGGKGVATLAQVKADPGLAKGWDAPPDAIKSVTAYLAVPLSAAAPRLVLLEKKMAGDRTVHLAVDPVALKGRFDAEAKAEGAKFWNPAGDGYTYTRTLGSYLPADEGGKDTGQPGQRLSDRYKAELLPPSVFAVPPGLNRGEAVERLIVAAASVFGSAFLTPPTPRERIQRGLYYEAIPLLVANRDQFAAGIERARLDPNREKAIQQWVKNANDVYGALSRARLNARQSPGAVAEAQSEVERLWAVQDAQNGGIAPMELVAAAVGGTGLSEATYLLALCKHEIAEAAQARYEAAASRDDPDAADRAKEQARDAWTDARDWWKRYEPMAAEQNAAFPGRAAHAEQLAGRADSQAARIGR